MEYKRIIAHTDFDGVASAALCRLVYGNLDIMFAGPTEIYSRSITAETTDIVVDLPYASGCGVWFDHHDGNLGDLKLLGVDPASVPGKHEAAPSCARVIYSHFENSFSWPAHIRDLIPSVDRVDSFEYTDIDDWMRDTPDKIIDLALKYHFDQRRDYFAFLKSTAIRLSTTPLVELIEDPDIHSKYLAMKLEYEKSMVLIDKGLKWAENGTGKILLLDYLEYKQPIRLNKSLAFLRERNAHVVIAITPLFNRGVKATGFMITASLSITAPKNTYDIGSIMRDLNIGDGHPGAAAGKVVLKDKPTMLNSKKKILGEIVDALNEQEKKASA